MRSSFSSRAVLATVAELRELSPIFRGSTHRKTTTNAHMVFTVFSNSPCGEGETFARALDAHVTADSSMER